MTEKSNLVKKETLLYALLIGFVVGFISGAIFAVYKLGPTDTPDHPATPPAATAPTQLSNQTSEAITNMEAEVTVNPDNVAAWTQLGHLYYDSGQTAQAIQAYTKSLALQPNNADVWTDMGVMYRRNKQPEKAIESFDKAFSVNPKHEPSRLNKGIVLLYDFNKPQEAIAAWKELLAINPLAKLNNGMPLTQAIEEIKKEMNSKSPKK
ncbi:MAG TPA: tetratricopeptide repeat protein [Desulfocapsa sulfexigens]|nr:tetratricopeptide repeat protein [Desulfocapsa sulfexigens]